jgi:excisionase family DNA binding protein
MIENLKLFTVEETAKILKVSVRQVWRYVKSEKLKVITLSPKTLRFSEKDIKEFLESK